MKTEVKEEIKEEPQAILLPSSGIANSGDVEMAGSENEVTPVGQEYIEEIKNEDGTIRFVHRVNCFLRNHISNRIIKLISSV